MDSCKFKSSFVFKTYSCLLVFRDLILFVIANKRSFACISKTIWPHPDPEEQGQANLDFLFKFTESEADLKLLVITKWLVQLLTTSKSSVTFQ